MENKSTSGQGRRLAFPRGAVHRFRQPWQPGREGALRYHPSRDRPAVFRESAEVIKAVSGGPPDRAKMAEIMIRHGLTPAPRRPQA